MSMTCTLNRVAAADVGTLLTNPARAREILSADDENWIISRPKGVLGFLLRFTPISVETATRKEPEAPEELESLAETECDLDWAWHGLHYLFTGTAWEIHPHAVPFLIRKFEDTARELEQFRFLQTRLELDGFASRELA